MWLKQHMGLNRNMTMAMVSLGGLKLKAGAPSLSNDSSGFSRPHTHGHQAPRLIHPAWIISE